jgi:hypothetical protein
MRKFLVCHDYGTGGLWWWIEAPSADDIHAKFRDLIVLDQPPTWWNDEMDRHAKRYRLSEPPDEPLSMLTRNDS